MIFALIAIMILLMKKQMRKSENFIGKPVSNFLGSDNEPDDTENVLKVRVVNQKEIDSKIFTEGFQSTSPLDEVIGALSLQ